MKSFLITLVLPSVMCISVRAQRQIIVMSYESQLPVRDVYIRIDTCQTPIITNYQGIAVIPDTFALATLSNKNHLQAKLRSDEIADSVWLIPKAHTLDEVVVWGERKALSKRFALPKTTDPLLKQKGPSGTDILQTLYDLFHHRRKKLNEKAKEVLKNY